MKIRELALTLKAALTSKGKSEIDKASVTAHIADVTSIPNMHSSGVQLGVH